MFGLWQVWASWLSALFASLSPLQPKFVQAALDFLQVANGNRPVLVAPGQQVARRIKLGIRSRRGIDAEPDKGERAEIAVKRVAYVVPAMFGIIVRAHSIKSRFILHGEWHPRQSFFRYTRCQVHERRAT